jgi:hypothetical protein
MTNMHTTLLKVFQEYKKQSWGGEGGGQWFWEATFFLMAKFAINQNSKMR